MDIKGIVNFIFEIGQLKRQVHSGFQLCGVRQPASIAEHSLRAAQIGYILAEMEGADPEKVASMMIIHDNAETRIGDQNKIASRYIGKDVEGKAFDEQIAGLGDGLVVKWKAYFSELKNRNTKEGIVAKDADWLEIAFQAKEYADIGYRSAQDIIENVAKAVETESAKKIIEEMKKTEFSDWWDGLKKMTYEKLK